MGIFSNFRGENKKFLKPPPIYKVLYIASGFPGFLHQQYGKNDLWMTKDVKTWRVESKILQLQREIPQVQLGGPKSRVFFVLCTWRTPRKSALQTMDALDGLVADRYGVTWGP